MGRIKASLADVSSEFTPVEPGVYELEVKHCKEHTDDQTQRVHYEIKSEIVGLREDGDESAIGRAITERIHIHKRDGELNEMGLGQLKRYFEVTVGEERANAEDLDTDEMVNQRFLGQVAIREYEVEDSLTKEKVKRRNNEIARYAPLG